MISNLKVIRNYKQLYKERQILFSKKYVDDSFELSLKFLEIPHDLPVLYNWLSQYSGKIFQSNCNQQDLRHFFESMLASKFALSFLCELNKKPIAQVELYSQSYKDSLAEFQYQQDDFELKLLTAPELNNQKHPLVSVIKFCLEYVFSKNKTNRLIFQTDLENEDLNESLIEAGFCFAQKIQSKFRDVNIYTCSRLNYLTKFTPLRMVN